MRTAGLTDCLRLQFMDNAKGLWLYVHRWEVPKPSGLVFICHGYGEHAGRYAHVAQVLVRLCAHQVP